MKTLLMSVILLASFNSMAKTTIFDQTTAATAFPFVTSYSTTTADRLGKVEAVAVLNDAQEAIQSGKISILLGSKINEKMNSNNDLSEVEALELVIESAEAILK